MKMLAIQKSLAGHAAPKILVPGRIFIKEGVLKKVSRNIFAKLWRENEINQ